MVAAAVRRATAAYARRLRDDGAVRRAARAAIVVPSVFAIGILGIGDIQLATFAAIGAFCQVLLVEFGGPMHERIQAEVALVVTGGVLIMVGTLVSPYIWLSAPVTALVAFGILFSGVVSSVLASASLSLLLGVILSVSLPAGPEAVVPRLAGWGLAAGAALLAIRFLWPAPTADPLRAEMVMAARALAARLRAGAAKARGTVSDKEYDAIAARADAAVDRLHGAFLATPHRPTGLTTSARTRVRLVDELAWIRQILAHRAAGPTGTAAACAAKEAAAAVLDESATLLAHPHRSTEPLHTSRETLRRAVATMAREATVSLPVTRATAAIGRAGHTTTAALPDGDPTNGPDRGRGGRHRGTGPDVRRAAVTGPNASGADVSDPNLSGPHASGAGVSDPDLRGPNASDAGVSDPDLSGADVNRPDISDERRAGGSAGAGGDGRVGGRGSDAEPVGLRPVEEFVSALEPSFRVQEVSHAIGLVARDVEASVAAERRTWAQRLLGQQPGGVAGPLTAARERAAAHLQRHSTWLHNSLRGAVGVAIAVLVAHYTGVQHSFWVIFGTLAVLRSNALSTGQNAVRAMLGTVAGFVIGAAILIGIGSDTTVLWPLLPLAVLMAGIAPALISFAAGQAAFTVTLLILFNIIQPAGWQLGLIRIEDVAIGVAISIVVGVLLWPRGARTALRHALADAYDASARYLHAAVAYAALCCDGGAAASRPPPPTGAAQRAAAASRRLDDTFRTYLIEQGAKPMPLADLTSLVNGVTGLRLAADAVLDLWRRDDPAEGDRAAARTLLMASSGAVERWYADLAASIVGRRHAPSPAPPDLATDGQLLDAVRRDLAGDDGTATATAVRVIWTADHLDAARRLEATLAGPARTAESFTPA